MNKGCQTCGFINCCCDDDQSNWKTLDQIGAGLVNAARQLQQLGMEEYCRVMSFEKMMARLKQPIGFRA